LFLCGNGLVGPCDTCLERILIPAVPQVLLPHGLPLRGLHQQPAHGSGLRHRPADLRPDGPGPGASPHRADGADVQQIPQHQLHHADGQDLHRGPHRADPSRHRGPILVPELRARICFQACRKVFVEIWGLGIAQRLHSCFTSCWCGFESRLWRFFQ